MKRLSVLAVLGLFAGLFAIGGEPSLANTYQNPYCSGVVNGGTFAGNLIVQPGGFCMINNVTVNGHVLVGSNSVFEACQGTIKGNLNATESYVNVEGTTILGGVDINRPKAISLTQSGCTYQGSETYSTILCPDSVGMNIRIHDAAPDSGEVEVGDDCANPGINPVKGSVIISNNRVEVTVAGNTILGSLICTNNDPQAESEDNTFPNGGRVIGCLIETEE